MKTCNTCSQQKVEDEFYWQNKDKGRRFSQCIECVKARRKAAWASGAEKAGNYEAKARRVKAAQDFLWSILVNSKCYDCGERNPVVFEFDHVSGNKICDIAKMVSSNYGLEAIKAEVAKCDVVCANCHKIRTSVRANHWRVQRLTRVE